MVSLLRITLRGNLQMVAAAVLQIIMLMLPVDQSPLCIVDAVHLD
jgi:hypothetical protein